MQRKKMRFFSEIRDFGYFFVFRTQTNLSGIVVMNFDFKASGTLLVSILEDLTKKMVGFKDKTHLKMSFRVQRNTVNFQLTAFDLNMTVIQSFVHFVQYVTI